MTGMKNKQEYEEELEMGKGVLPYRENQDMKN